MTHGLTFTWLIWIECYFFFARLTDLFIYLCYRVPCARDKPNCSLPIWMKARIRKRERDSLFTHAMSNERLPPVLPEAIVTSNREREQEREANTELWNLCTDTRHSGLQLAICFLSTFWWDVTCPSHFVSQNVNHLVWKKKRRKRFCFARFLERMNSENSQVCKSKSTGGMCISCKYVGFFYLMLLCYANQNQIFRFVS